MQNKTQNTLLAFQGPKSVSGKKKKKEKNWNNHSPSSAGKKVWLKFNWEPLIGPVLSRLTPTLNVNFHVGDKLGQDW